MRMISVSVRPPSECRAQRPSDTPSTNATAPAITPTWIEMRNP